VSADNPITSRKEDQLGRAGFANSIATAVRSLDASRGLVVAVLGPWGLGKTSMLNMVVEALKEPPALEMVEFNPWLFSGTEQLLANFFGELASQLRVKPSKTEQLANLLADYGEALASLKAIPVAGQWLGVAGSGGKFVGRLIRRDKSKDPISVQRERLEQALAQLDQPIVVMIDDIDRLQPQEVCDIFRLVRLTGHFPQLIYLLAFDRARVEKVLDQDGFEGRAYLEKIVEVIYDLPPVPPPALDRVLVDGLNSMTASLTTGPFDAERWPDVFYQVVRPLFTNLRDVKRYLAALPAMLSTLGDEVALIDVLALEAVRVLLPDVHAELPGAASALTGVNRVSDSGTDADAPVQRMIDAADPHHLAIQALCRLLFPATGRLFGGLSYGQEWLSQWRRERRVASPQVLGFYLSRVLEPGVAPASLVEAAFHALPDEAALRALLRDLDSTTLEDLLARLEAYEDKFPPETAEPAAAVLLELYPRLRRTRGFMDPGPEAMIWQVLLRLLRRVTDARTLTAIIERLCQRHGPLFGQLELLVLVGHFPNAGHRLIPAADAERLYRDLCRRIRRADAQQLASERGVLRLVTAALQDEPTARDDLDRLLADPHVVLALLQDAVDTVQTQPQGSVAVRQQPVLLWDQLVAVFGNQTNLRGGLAAVEMQVDTSSLDEQAKQALDLARRYNHGWRPTLPFAAPAVTSRSAPNGPRHLLVPLSDQWPDVILRAVCSFAAAPGQAQQVSLVSRDVHQRIATALAASDLTAALAELGHRRGLQPASGPWETDGTFDQNLRAAVLRVPVTPKNAPLHLQGRCGVLLPGVTDPTVRVVVEIHLTVHGDEGQGQDAESSPPPPPSTWRLSVVEARDLLAAAIGAADHLGRTVLPNLLGGHASPPSSVELHLAARQPDTAGQRAATLADIIDLEPLGASTRPAPSEGQFATDSDARLDEPATRKDIATRAVRYMAHGWGYLDADKGLQHLLN